MKTPLDQPPAWISDAVFYQIFPDRFARSARVTQPSNLEAWDSPPTFHGYKGGNLLGIVDRIDWLTDLGVNAIYLNPIFQSASNHRYHTHDYFTVDPLLGGQAAFDEMLSVCHRRGIRVVLDGVFNHASRGFFQFNDVLENGTQSPWVNWFHIHGWPLRAYDPDQSANYTAWWGLHALPKLNTDNPEVREYLMGVGEHWARLGIDGWRLDVPEEITTPGFWEEFRARTRAVNPDLYLVGEIWHDATDWTVAGDRFDGAMNYPLTGATLSFTAGHRVKDAVVEGITYTVRPPKNAAAYANAVDHLLGLYPPVVQRANLNLLGSHDTPRPLTVAGGDRDSVVLAALLMFTFPGAPCIYYGDEVGLPGARDPDCRRSFPWDNPDSWDTVTLDAYRSLAALRTSHRALRAGRFRRVWPRPGAHGMLYAYAREDDDETLLVAVNAGEQSETVAVPGIRADGAQLVWGRAGLAPRNGAAELAVEARSGAVWKLAGSP